MDIDEEATLRSYIEDGRRSKDVFINPATLVWDYLVYRCTICGRSSKYKFRDIEKKVREHFSSLGEEYRDYFENLDRVDFKRLDRSLPRPYSSKSRKKTGERIKRTYESREEK
ncbi:MAG: hypothetical protein GF334_03410 [Candidatus Altiarchaeales archaeon]|nr:hypothetical protein [Candidatus Altiarchaeales archaeon]